MADPGSAENSSGDAIAQALRAEILAGELSAGERLVEESLAKRYGVSRIPVREALARLQSEGFVTIVRHRGATVSASLIHDGHELLQVRRGLEVFAAQLAAENRGGAVARELAEIADGRSGEGSSFHELIAIASGNEQLRELLTNVNQRVGWSLGRNPETSAADHRAVAMAVRNGAAVQAAYLMDEHLRRDEQFFNDQFGT
ncbi:GntR family transcriptional regulator [Nocardia sp. NBC_01327]|uniref:GntR family transcriptional regulator n=1 Tax=Nocardia sp. NBC_01327 TaxID=2903593 RepID=UPI002E0D48C8|nr:GntR family transcriptional regulator [Nocardia sp. NBC_01327]